MQQGNRLFSKALSLSNCKRLLVIGVVLVSSLTQSACGLFSKPAPAPLPEQRILKKKIVMTGFAVKVPAQVQDMDDIAQGIPRELLSRLERSGNFMVRQSKNLLSYDLQQDAPSAKLVKQVAAENDAQFVIAGEIRSAGVRSDKKYFGLWETRRRHIEIEFAIYDGLTGAFLQRHHLYRPAEDDSKIGRDKPFGSVAFYATNYGKAIDSILEESVGWIRRDLSAFPMVAKIIQINGKRLMIDAGVTSNLRVGDTGQVVSDYDELPVLGMTSMQARPTLYGTPQASMGMMTINQTQLQLAMADLDGDAEVEKIKVKVGDYVRFDGSKP